MVDEEIIDNNNDEDNILDMPFSINEFTVESNFIEEEIEDDRINDLAKEAISVNIIKETQKDIDIDFCKLLDITDPKVVYQLDKLKSINIKRRKVNGTKYFKFLRDLRIIVSHMSKEEIQYMLSLRVMYEKYHTLKKKEIENTLDAAIHTFIPFVNKFVDNIIDPIAYLPKYKVVDEVALQELFFSEDHLKLLLKIIVLSKITLIFTDCVDKTCRAEAKKVTGKKLWNTYFVEADRNIDVKNKIKKLIESRFISTMYNEKRFWSAAQFANINVVSQANIIYNELQTDSVLMLEFDKNPLSFLDVFLKNIIYYLSKRKFHIEFILNNFDAQSNVMKSEITTEFTYHLLEDTLMKKTIDKFIKKEVYPKIKTQDIDIMNRNFTKNILHFWLVVPYLSRKLNVASRYLMSIEKDKFIPLIIYLYYKLISLNCFNMAKLLISNIKEIKTGAYNENIKNSSVVLSKFIKSKELNMFLENKNINNNITDSLKILINPLVTMTMNEYIDFNGNKVEVTTSELINEYIKYMNDYLELQ